jgi:apolipoprotein D and lipocalin family protein
MMGRWYEVAYSTRGPSSHQYARTLDFRQDVTGELKVTKTWHWESFYGREDTDTTSVQILDRASNAKLRFEFYLGQGTVWIIDMDPDYRYVMMGTPDRYQLWILSRTPSIPDDVYAEMEKKAAVQGFDIKYLTRVPW